MNDTDIATVSIEELNEILLPFNILDGAPKVIKNIESEHLDILKILEMNGIKINDFRKTGSRYSGSHPVHGSESGNNFTFKTNGGLLKEFIVLNDNNRAKGKIVVDERAYSLVVSNRNASLFFNTRELKKSKSRHTVSGEINKAQESGEKEGE